MSHPKIFNPYLLCFFGNLPDFTEIILFSLELIQFFWKFLDNLLASFKYFIWVHRVQLHLWDFCRGFWMLLDIFIRSKCIIRFFLDLSWIKNIKKLTGKASRARPGLQLLSRAGTRSAPAVRLGAAGLLTDIECSRVRDSSWMYLTSLVTTK